MIQQRGVKLDFPIPEKWAGLCKKCFRTYSKVLVASHESSPSSVTEETTEPAHELIHIDLMCRAYLVPHHMEQHKGKCNITLLDSMQCTWPNGEPSSWNAHFVSAAIALKELMAHG